MGLMEFFVYIDWTRESPPRPFYVGKGTRHRVQDRVRNTVHSKISAKYGMRREVVFSTSDEVEAFTREKELISSLRTRVKLAGNWGANFSEGGVGGSTGWKAPDVWRKAASARQMARLSTSEARSERSRTAKEAWAVLKASGFTMSEAARSKKCGPKGPESLSTREAKRIAGLHRWEQIRTGALPAPVLSSEARSKLGSGKNVLHKAVQSERDMVMSTFESLTDASKVTGVGVNHISECCRGKRKTAGGYVWRYL
jgi:hypothetical protein